MNDSKFLVNLLIAIAAIALVQTLVHGELNWKIMLVYAIGLAMGRYVLGK